MRIDALIFDLDGTLWDTGDVCAEAWNRARLEMTLDIPPVTGADVRGIAGKTEGEIAAILFPGRPTEEQLRQYAKLTAYELDYVRRCAASCVYPGVREGLAQLSARFPLALVSNCGADYLECFLEKTALGRYFKDSSCHGLNGLPKGENITLVVERNGFTHAAYIGDTAGDEASARFARAPFFHAAYGFGRVQSPVAAFEDFAQLTSFFVER